MTIGLPEAKTKRQMKKTMSPFIFSPFLAFVYQNLLFPLCSFKLWFVYNFQTYLYLYWYFLSVFFLLLLLLLLLFVCWAVVVFFSSFLVLFVRLVP